MNSIDYVLVQLLGDAFTKSLRVGDRQDKRKCREVPLKPMVLGKYRGVNIFLFREIGGAKSAV